MGSANTLSEEQQLRTAKRLFYAGWVCLPILWFYNVAYFFPVIWGSSSPIQRHLQSPVEEEIVVSAEYMALRKWIIYSFIGGILAMIPLVAWYVIYVIQRQSWGPLGDQLSLIIPKGS
jgi:presenilin enhancer 2